VTSFVTNPGLCGTFGEAEEIDGSMLCSDGSTAVVKQ
jgi:hypothetical protein